MKRTLHWNIFIALATCFKIFDPRWIGSFVVEKIDGLIDRRPFKKQKNEPLEMVPTERENEFD